MTEILLQIILDLIPSSIIGILTLFVLFITLIVVIIYTVFTKQQTDELIKQRRLSIMPSLVHSLEVGVTGKLNITNLGLGTAINISIDTIIIPDNKNSHFEFEPISIIPAGKKLLVEYEYLSDSERAIDSLDLLDMTNSFYEFEIVFNFYDIEGTKYRQTNRFGKNGYQHGFVERL